ncbi:PaaI family thioesterase [Luteimonas sp. Y-2-2-4F]|nr:PaaI family thioesterase [Luteimonas sp. Y-2-2-4F]MCD9032593.1 PaaI family thioesterase [Luteimonas sp. Y-2-2-4F]
MPTTGDDINALIRSLAPPELRELLPPPCLLDMQGAFLEYEEGRRLSLRFPVLPRYRNPMGNMQGGFIVAALDNTLGPLSYLIAPPSVTAILNTQYLRPVGADVPHLVCEARLVERTRNVLHLAAEARTGAGKVVALCQATQQIMQGGPPAR